ncbi:MAG: Bug family tripartite tricarboxylate transporter substrate binding protein [Advenella sp.]
MHNLLMKLVVTGLISLWGHVAVAAESAADSYPTHPIKFVVGYPPGGASDIVSRLVAADLQQRLGQPVVVENRPGAGGNIATEAVLREKADGYTILLGTIAHATNMSVYKNLKYDTLRDFKPVIQFSAAPSVLVVNAKSSIKTVADIVKQAGDKPNEMTFGSSGVGGSPHLAGELFRLKTNIDIRHVPYKGAGPVLNDLMGGFIDMSFMTIPGAISQIQAGALRPIAIASDKRSALLPDTPTLAESGVKDFLVSSWNGLLVRKDTPPAIVHKLNREINEILKQPKLVKQIEIEGSAPVGGTSEEFEKFIESEITRWAEVVKQANVTL